MCCLSWEDWALKYLHFEHLNGFSPVWMRTWAFRFPAWLNEAPHSSLHCGWPHFWQDLTLWLWSSRTICIYLIWFLRPCTDENTFWQASHFGLSFSCRPLKWLLSCLWCVKSLPHSPHWKSFFSRWSEFMWSLKFFFEVKDVSQSSHLNIVLFNFWHSDLVAILCCVCW